MDQKQFDLFQTGIQWVADEVKYKTPRSGWVAGARKWLQRTWAQGILLNESLTVKDPHNRNSYIDVQVVCPTACCVAGNFCAINGDTFVSASAYVYGSGVSYAETLQWVIDDEDNLHPIGTRGRDLVGITENEASRLFHQNNSSGTVIRLAQQIAEAHGYRLNIIE